MSTTKKINDEIFETIYHAAQAKGALAAQKCVPTPMTVVQHANPLNDSSEVQRHWDVPTGVCGFAWVVIKPGTSAFAKWLVKHNHAKAHYYGGVSIWISVYGQCHQKKVVHAQAMAEYLNKVGIRAYSQDRLD